MRGRASLWLSWTVLFASLAIWAALPRLVEPRRAPWNAAETAVAGFVLAILGLAATVGTFAIRESLAQRSNGGGGAGPAAPVASLRMRMVGLWLLCAAIGALGGIMIHYSGSLAAGLPYLVGAAALFVLHAPRARFVGRA